jgi:hypothetical protein
MDTRFSHVGNAVLDRDQPGQAILFEQEKTAKGCARFLNESPEFAKRFKWEKTELVAEGNTS